MFVYSARAGFATDNPAFGSQLLQSDLLFHLDTHTDTYHIDVVRVALTRGYGSRFPEIADEIKCTFLDLIPPTSGKSYCPRRVLLLLK
jgi:hypothetical protein